MATAHFTTAQQMSIALAPKFSAFLSIVGSGYISFCVLVDAKKRGQSYHRLLMAMSIYDVSQSVAFFLTTWPTPVGTPGVFGAVGTTATCSAQGFFLALGLAVPVYNAFLSLFYLLLIKYNWKDARIRKFEVVAHILPFLYYIPSAIAFAVMGYYNNSGNVCILESLPFQCEGDECIRGEKAAMFRKVFGLIPHVICLVIGTVAMAMLYWTVREQEKRNARFAGNRLARGDSNSSKHKKSRRVARQALLYLSAYYFCFTWSMISGISVADTGELQFVTYLMGTFFTPLQGFFNMIVYRSPKCLKTMEPTSQALSSFVTKSRSVLHRISSRHYSNNQEIAIVATQANGTERAQARTPVPSSSNRVVFVDKYQGDPVCQMNSCSVNATGIDEGNSFK